MNQLQGGRHINGYNPDLDASIRAHPGGSLLVLDTAIHRELLEFHAAAVPDGDRIGRLYAADEEPNDPERRVDDLCRAFDPVRHLLTGILVPGTNERKQEEIDKHGNSPIKRLTEHNITCAEILHARGWPNVIGGGFSTTKPTLAAWKLFLPALEYLDGVASHEYIKPEGHVGGFGFNAEGIGHCQELWDATPAVLRRPFYITESGFDDDAGRGWAAYVTPAAYAAWLRFIGGHYALLPFVKAWMVYQTGAEDPGWSTFEFSNQGIDAFFSEGERRLLNQSGENFNNGEAMQVGFNVGQGIMDEKLATYANWALARIQNGEEPRDSRAFREHLIALGGDGNDVMAYGFPQESVYVSAVSLREIAGHINAVKEMIDPFL